MWEAERSWELDAGGSRDPVVVLHESGRRWIEVLRDRLAACGVQVCHSAAARDTLALVRAHTAVAAIVELGPRPVDSLDLMESLARAAHVRWMVVVARRAQAGLELAARELGASCFEVEPMTAGQLATIVESLVRRQRALTDY